MEQNLTLEESNKGGRNLKIIGIIAVLALVAVVVGINLFGDNVKNEALSAVKAAVKEDQDLTNTIYKDFPYMAKSIELGKDNCLTEAEIFINNIEDESMADVLEILKSGSLKMSVAQDKKNKSSVVDFGVNAFGNELVNLEIGMHGSTYTFAVPQLMEKVYSVDMENLVADYEKSIFANGQPVDDETKQQLELLSAIYKEYPEMLNSISYDGIINDTDTISQKLVASLDKAAFERTDDGKIKAVIKAADMTSSFKDIYNFVMNNSSLKGYFGFLINRAAVADPTIKDLLNADSISEKISLSDAEIILDINGGKLKNISIVCSAGVDEATAVFKIEQDRNEGSNTTISISAQEAEILALDIFESYADGKLDMGIKLNITENENKVTYDLGTIQYKDKTDDNVEMKLNMLVSDTSVGNMSMNFDSLATMKVEGDSVVTLMPTMKIAFNMDGLDSSVIDIKMNQKMSPLPEGVQVPESVNLMTLSQEDMDNLTAEVQQKVYGLLMPFLGI